MRGGICSIQLQALTPEAATVVKQALNLATRRGHAQVTPLHVASAMLATSTGLLRKACLQCHSHPLQCKALELCFNVALNRLPASTPSPLLGPNHHLNQYSTTPSLSNALVAAFKRAQAHQRRGSIENQQQQQQHILALKIEVEQLIISILDDPSVSRVMREAGFSSTLVKTRVEQAVSIEVCSQKGTDRSQSKDNNNSTRPNQVLNAGGGGSNVSPSRPFGQFVISPHSSLIKHVDHHHHANIDDDVTSVLNELVKRRRNTVIVGESLANAEGVARGVMERFEVGNVPGELRYVQFVSLPLVYFRNIGKDEVEQKIMEVRSLVKSYVGRGIILYLGDLKWLFEFWSNYCEKRTNYYCSVEHMVMEIKKLVSGSVENNSSNNRLWLMGIANFKTYMKCKISHPSLETIWELHPFTIPVGSLSLSLNFDSDFQAQERRSKVLFTDLCFEDGSGVKKNLTCCRDCSLNFEKEAQSITNSVSKKVCTTASSLLPAWLQNCKEEKSHIMENDEENARLKDLCKKWNSFCNSVHRHRHRHISILEKPVLFGSSSSPSSPNSVSSSHEAKSNLHHHSLINWPIISTEPEEKVPTKECKLLYTDENTNNDDDDDACYAGNLIMFMPDHNRNLPKPDLLSNPNSSPNSASSSEAVEGLDSTEMFREVNAENLKILCDALERKVPQHKHNIPEIASTILHCRSGMRKKGEQQNKQETWMVFLGENSESKESISREIAKVVFGSYNNFVTIGMSKYDSNDEESKSKSKSKKRARDEFGSSYLQRFWEAANENPHRVFFMEDLDRVDNFSRKGLKEAIESGSVTLPSCGESIPLKDAIVIFSCESRFISASVPIRSSTQIARMSLSDDNQDNNKGKDQNINVDDDDDGNLKEKSPSLCLDLNLAAIEDDNNGILELVDKQINFNTQKL